MPAQPATTTMGRRRRNRYAWACYRKFFSRALKYMQILKFFHFSSILYLHVLLFVIACLTSRTLELKEDLFTCNYNHLWNIKVHARSTISTSTTKCTSKSMNNNNNNNNNVVRSNPWDCFYALHMNESNGGKTKGFNRSSRPVKRSDFNFQRCLLTQSKTGHSRTGPNGHFGKRILKHRNRLVVTPRRSCWCKRHPFMRNRVVRHYTNRFQMRAIFLALTDSAYIWIHRQ